MSKCAEVDLKWQTLFDVDGKVIPALNKEPRREGVWGS
jgi:hypothetical protein